MNKISEKAVWEELSPDSSDSHYPGSSIHTQPHMMICFKCNQIIPENSVFCPSCGIQLYFDCPKCKYKFPFQKGTEFFLTVNNVFAPQDNRYTQDNALVEKYEIYI